MITLEIIQRIKSIYSKGVGSDDTSLSSRHVYSKLKTVRNKLISQQVKKRQKISDWNFTLLPCVELIKVPNHECECFVDYTCEVYRTKYPLPKMLTDLNRHLIQFVMSIDNGMKIEEVSRQEALYSKGNKYTSKSLKYVFEKGYLYFTSINNPGLVKIKFVAEDPLEAAKFPSACNTCEDCTECRHYANVEFPIDGDLVDTLVELSAQELIQWFGMGRKDNNNNNLDDSAIPPTTPSRYYGKD